MQFIIGLSKTFSWMQHSSLSPKFRALQRHLGALTVCFAKMPGGQRGQHADLLEDFVFDVGHGSGLLKVNLTNDEGNGEYLRTPFFHGSRMA
jgi:hypothetical protein